MATIIGNNSGPTGWPTSARHMDGIEAAGRIRRLQDAGKASVPIIAVSANVYGKERNAAMEAGMNAFTEKPVSAERLFAAIDRCLQPQL